MIEEVRILIREKGEKRKIEGFREIVVLLK